MRAAGSAGVTIGNRHVVGGAAGGAKRKSYRCAGAGAVDFLVAEESAEGTLGVPHLDGDGANLRHVVNHMGFVASHLSQDGRRIHRWQL